MFVGDFTPLTVSHPDAIARVDARFLEGGRRVRPYTCVSVPGPYVEGPSPREQFTHGDLSVGRAH
jgi:hypothetical protein